MDADDERGLVLASQRGDRAAFVALARHYRIPVYRTAFALIRDRDQARLIAIETWVRAWKTIRGVPEGQRFFLWVSRLTRALSVAHQRKRPGAGGTPRSQALADDGEEDVMLARAALERCEIGFAGISAEHQYALTLRIVQRLTYAEIARALDVQAAATIVRIAGARAALLARIDRPGEAA